MKNLGAVTSRFVLRANLITITRSGGCHRRGQQRNAASFVSVQNGETARAFCLPAVQVE